MARPPLRLGARRTAPVPMPRTALYCALEQALSPPVLAASTPVPGWRAAAFRAALSLAALGPVGAASAATITVNGAGDTIVDDDVCILREAVDNANADAATHDDCTAGSGLDTIVFDPALGATTITLDSQLTVSDALAIDGPGADVLTLDANNAHRHIQAQAPLSVDGLTFRDGYAVYGGAIAASDDLVVTNSRFKYNSASLGGALSSNPDLPGSPVAKGLATDGVAWSISNTEFRGNDALPGSIPVGMGGGLFFSAKYGANSLEVIDSEFINNQAGYGAGGGGKGPGIGEGLGGGMAVFSAPYDGLTTAVDISGTDLYSNEATIGGGAMLAVSTLSISGGTFGENTALYTGGGLAAGKYAYSPTAKGGPATFGSVALDGTRFNDNQAGSGAGATITASTITADALEVTGNETTYGPQRAAAADDDAGKGKGGHVCDGYNGGGLQVFAAQSLVLTSSTISGNCAGEDGGGAAVRLGTDATASVTGNLFTGNTADSDHGGLGLYLRDGASATVSGTFTGNRSYDEGGAIGVVNDGGSALLDGLQVSGNTASFYGGGVSLELDAGYTSTGSTVTIQGGNFSDNEAFYGDGGGIRINVDATRYIYTYGSGGSTVTVAQAVSISGSTITGNAAGEGGGVFFESYGTGTLTVTEATIDGNSASYGGGGIAAEPSSSDGSGALVIERSTLSNNIARNGGGLLIDASSDSGATARMVNSTVHGNSAQLPLVKGTAPSGNGGGIALQSAGLELLFATVTGNSAEYGGGLSVDAGSTATAANSIIADNSASGGGADVAGTLTASFTLVEDVSGAILAGSNNTTGLDPLLGPLADNGGPTLTRLPQPGSPVVDSGDPAFTPPPDTDQRGTGFPRLQGAVVDKGAVELQLAQVVALDILPASFAEGGTSTLTVTLDATTGMDVLATVGFSGAAVLGTDFTAEDDDPLTAGIQVLIPANSSSGSIVLTALDDALDEVDEALTATITAVEGASVTGTVSGSALIVDGDVPTVTLSLGQAMLIEEAGSTEVIATLSQVAASDVLVTLALSGTAASGVDYTMGDDDAAAGVQILIPAGSLTGSVTLATIDDGAYEGNETVVVDIDSVTNAAESGAQQVTATIDDGADLSGGGIGNPPPPNPAPELIPTLSEWMLMLLGLLLPATVVGRLRRQPGRAQRRV